MTDYTKAANDLLRVLFFEDWMSETDWHEFKTELFKESRISVEQLAKDFEKGVEMGYSVDRQIEIVKQQFKR